MSKILYEENQLYRKTNGFYFLLVFISTIVLIFGVELFNQAWDESTKSFIRNPNPDLIKAFVVVFLLQLYIFISAYRLELKVVVNDRYLEYRLVPFVKKQMLLKETLKRFEIKNGKSVSKYKGWAFRRIFGLKRKTYIIEGDNAIYLQLKNGTEILLGTQNPAMFAKAIERLKRKKDK